MMSKAFLSTFGGGRNQAHADWFESDKELSLLFPSPVLTSLEPESAKWVETHWAVKKGLGFLLLCALGQVSKLLGPQFPDL